MKRILVAVFLIIFSVTTGSAQSVNPLSVNSYSGKHFTGEPEFISFSKSEMPDINQLAEVMDKYGFHAPAGLTLIGMEEDNLGMIHYRYIQTYYNHPVDASMWMVHTRNGKIESMNGVLYHSISSSANASISIEDAHKAALAYVPAESYYDEQEDTEIYWASSDNSYKVQSYRLSYRFDIYAEEPRARKYVFVDANSGKVIAEQDRIHESDVPGSAVTSYSSTQPIITDSYSGGFRLRESGRGGGIETYNLNHGTNYSSATDFSDADNIWNNVNSNLDQYATDAHWGTEMTYDFYFKNFNRNSFDNNGTKLRSYVHYSSGYLNAFWDGTKMTYGDGSAGYTPLTSIDICGHEVSHAVTQFTCKLIYSYESGALNESFSDCMGTAIEFYGKSASANWTMGEDIGKAFRNMANPKQYQHPNTYKGQYWYSGSGDNGGVHYNSGVMNHWFYILSVGKSGTNDLGNSYNVTGITIQKAAAILYRTWAVYLFQKAQYSDARTYSIQAAIDLYGTCSPEVIAVTQAWYAVGVGGSGGPSSYKPDVTITASPGNIVCPGVTVNFTAATVNAGSNPSYQWRVNGANTGPNSSVFSTLSLGNNDQVSCILTANSPCGTGKDTSNIIIMSINAGVAVSIASNPSNAICGGTPVTFSANPINGGSTPLYQWKLNGANVGSNTPVYTNATLNNGDQISCVMTSNVQCASGNPAKSNTITVTVNPGLFLKMRPSGKDAQLTSGAPSTNLGNSPEFLSFTWTCNSVLCLSRSLMEFDLTSLPLGSVITGAYLNLYADKNSQNNGYKGTPTYGTNNTAWLRRVTSTWQENTVTWANQPGYSTNNQVTLAQSSSTAQNYLNVNVTQLIQDMVNNGNYGFLLMAKNETQWYNSLIFGSGDNADTTIYPTLQICYIPGTCTASVSVTAVPGNSICAGDLVTFNAVPVNGGSAPSYQWKLNGVNVGTNSSTYTSTSLIANDKVSCVMTSSAACATVPATSNTITISITPPSPASVIITASTNNFCLGTPVTFIATSTNGGTSPKYEWKVNGLNVGTNNATYTSTSLSNGDKVSCVMTSSISCATNNPATSNIIVMTVTPGVVLKIGPSGKDATLATSTSSGNFGNHTEYHAATWTCGGVLCLGRTLMEFDLTSIPAGSTITGAYLNLYAEVNNKYAGYTGSPTFGTNNAAWLRRVTAPWQENTVTWNNQPAFTIANQVTLAQSTTVTQSYLNVNVTALVQDMLINGNYGFMLMEKNETSPYNSLVFGSGDNPDSTIHPVLQICYTPATCTPAITIISNPGNAICTSSSVSFYASTSNGGTAPVYQWKMNGNNVGTNSATYNNASLQSNDKVTCLVTSNAACANGVQATSNEVTITVNPYPAKFNVTGGGAYCSSPGTGSVVGLSSSEPGVNYQLVLNGTANIGSLVSGTGSSISFGQQLASGSYTVTGINAAAGCSSIMNGSVSVSVTPSPIIIQSGNSDFCSGDSVTLSTPFANSYSWSNGASTQVIKVGAPGDYYVTVNGCSSASVPVTIYPLPSPEVTADGSTAICTGASVVLNDITTGIGLAYQWKKNGANLSGETSASYKATGGGTYTVVETNSFGCTGSATIIITEGGSAQSGIISAVRDTICEGTPVILSVTGNSNPLQWESSTTGSNFTDISGASNSNYIGLPDKTTYFRVKAGSGSCIATSSPHKITILPSPKAEYTYTQNGLVLNFNSSGSTGAANFNWSFGDNTSSTNPNPVHTYTVDTIYHVCLTVFNGSNCSYTVCKEINLALGVPLISANSQLKIYPNPFSDFILIENKQKDEWIENIKLYDVLGREIFNKSFEQTMENPIRVNLPALPEAVYFLKINTLGNEYVFPLVK